MKFITWLGVPIRFVLFLVYAFACAVLALFVGPQLLLDVYIPNALKWVINPDADREAC